MREARNPHGSLPLFRSAPVVRLEICAHRTRILQPENLIAYLKQNTLGDLRLRRIVPLGLGYLGLVRFPQVKTWGYLPSSLTGRCHRRWEYETGRVHSELGYRTNSPCAPTSAKPQFLAHTSPSSALHDSPGRASGRVIETAMHEEQVDSPAR